MADLTQSGFIRNRRRDELLKVAEQAAGWLIDLEEGGAKERAAFAAWLEESPLHVEMFLRASSVDCLMELLAPEDVKALVQSTSRADDAAMVIAWPKAQPGEPSFALPESVALPEPPTSRPSVEADV